MTPQKWQWIGFCGSDSEQGESLTGLWKRRYDELHRHNELATNDAVSVDTAVELEWLNKRNATSKLKPVFD